MKVDVCLVMIVRNEAHVIERCLNSARPLITRWLIVDTGSNDETIEIIEDRLSDVPGQLMQRPWVDFGHNRTELMTLARGRGDYLLLLDADEIVVIDDDFTPPHDKLIQAWRVTKIAGDTEVEYRLPCWLRSDHPWRFSGILHEYLDSPEAFRTSDLSGIRIRSCFDSARNQVDARTKYLRDAEVLEQALRFEPDNRRYQFYLAQSLRDAGEHERAVGAYRKRAAMGGWAEEVFYSLLCIGRLLESQNADHESVKQAYLDAFHYRPARAEPLVDLARVCRQNGEFAEALEYAQRAADLPVPGDILFVDTAAYRWRARDELSLACYHTGDAGRAFDITCSLLRDPCLPDDHRSRIERNRDLCVTGIVRQRSVYPESRVQHLTRAQARPPVSPRIAVTVTSGKRPHLFEATVNSFVHCCEDRDTVGEWICVDDGTDQQARIRMKQRYPFFTFVWKDENSVGHARSMNILLGLVEAGGFEFMLHLEDDWLFFEPRAFIAESLEILNENPAIGQVLFNRNYAEILRDRAIGGGQPQVTRGNRIRYIVHEHCSADDPAYTDFVAARGPRSCAYWPHYSLRPGLIRREVFRQLGAFTTHSSHFELDYANRFVKAGWKTAFLDTICSLHIGKLTWEAGENAYSLNRQQQFGHKQG